MSRNNITRPNIIKDLQLFGEVACNNESIVTALLGRMRRHSLPVMGNNAAVYRLLVRMEEEGVIRTKRLENGRICSIALTNPLINKSTLSFMFPPEFGVHTGPIPAFDESAVSIEPVVEQKVEPVVEQTYQPELVWEVTRLRKRLDLASDELRARNHTIMGLRQRVRQLESNIQALTSDSNRVSYDSRIELSKLMSELPRLR